MSYMASLYCLHKQRPNLIKLNHLKLYSKTWCIIIKVNLGIWLNIVILPYIRKLHIHGTNFHFWDLLVCFISGLCLSLLICCHVSISLILISPLCILDENVISPQLLGKFIKMVIEEMNPYASWQMKNFNVSNRY